MPYLRSKIITVPLVGICIWLLLLVIGAQIRYLDTRHQLNAVDDRLAGARKENNRLSGELELMRQPDWLALLARARLNYKRPDENVVFVYKNEKSGTISQPQVQQVERPNWRKWLDWLQGTKAGLPAEAP